MKKVLKNLAEHLFRCIFVFYQTISERIRVTFQWPTLYLLYSNKDIKKSTCFP